LARVVFELTMYLNLLRWVFRHPSIGPDDEPVGRRKSRR
jgi:hypothetical protein